MTALKFPNLFISIVLVSRTMRLFTTLRDRDKVLRSVFINSNNSWLLGLLHRNPELTANRVILLEPNHSVRCKIIYDGSKIGNCNSNIKCA